MTALVLIDGANHNAAARALAMTFDWATIEKYMRELGARRLVYYTALLEEESGNVPLMGLVDWLSFNGYTVVTKPAKEYKRHDGTMRTKGDMDIEIAVDAMKATWADHIILFSGDGDFVPLVHALKERGTLVTVVSSREVGLLNNDLRRQADFFIELKEQQGWLKSSNNAN